MWATLSVILLIVIAVLTYFLWKSDKECDEAETEAAKVREAAEADQKRHADEYQQSLDEIVRLDREVAASNAALETVSNMLQERTIERDEAIQSVEHIADRLKTSEGIRLQLAASLSGRANGHQITLGNGDAKIVHGSVVVSDPDADRGFLNICNENLREDMFHD